jgi:hypothetical protein
MRLGVLVAMALGLSAYDVAAQPQFQVYASVVDGTGTAPAALQPADISLMEDGLEAKVVKIETVSFPVKLQLLLDNGIGLGSDNIQHLRNGVRALLDGLPDGVEVTVVATAPQPRFLVRPTTDRQLVTKGLALLAPDGSAGRFVESLNEATQRIDRDKTEFAPIIVAFGTIAGDRFVRDSDVEQMSKRLQTRPTTVHVILLSIAGGRTVTGGANQTDVGVRVAEMTGGRFEAIAAPNRIATLLPEIGALVAKAHQSQTRQFKITAQRPPGRSGEIGRVSMGARGGLGVVSLSFDGRVRN